MKQKEQDFQSKCGKCTKTRRQVHSFSKYFLSAMMSQAGTVLALKTNMVNKPTKASAVRQLTFQGEGQTISNINT